MNTCSTEGYTRRKDNTCPFFLVLLLSVHQVCHSCLAFQRFSLCKWASAHTYVYTLKSTSAPAPSIQYHASKLDCRFVSYMILYMFQCHSPKSSHPRPLPQSPKDCSIHLCLFCCPTYRVIIYLLSKFHIYALVYCIGVFLSGLLHSV